MSYAKIFRTIFDGSMRGCSDLILVFVNMLCYADSFGVVDRTARAISDETGLPVERVNSAIATLEGPDPESRTPDEEGRRIVRLDASRSWGWRIVNHAKYRALCSREQNAERQRNFRGRNAPVTAKRYGALPPVSVSVSASASEGEGEGEGPPWFRVLLESGQWRRLTLDQFRTLYHTNLWGSSITEEEAATQIAALARGANWDAIHRDKHGEGGWLNWRLADIARKVEHTKKPGGNTRLSRLGESPKVREARLKAEAEGKGA